MAACVASVGTSVVAYYQQTIGWFLVWLSLLMETLVQNGPELSRARVRRGEANLDGEDRSERMDEEGKQLCPTPVDF